jgi:hypothetical protein
MRKILFVAVAIGVMSSGVLSSTFSHAVQAKPATPKKSGSIASKVECGDFTKNPDGSWTSARHAKVGKMEIQSTTFGRRVMMFGSEDLADVLDAKCGAVSQPPQAPPTPIGQQ